MSKKTDFIIVGQGLAGSALSLLLIDRGFKVQVFDDPNSNKSSSVAAGLFNPITGKKMVKTWLADQIWPFMYEFYRKAEKQTGKSFFHELPIYRPFLEKTEMISWSNGYDEERLQGYVKDILVKPIGREEVNDPFGGLLLERCGYLDIPAYLKAVCKYLNNLGIYHKEVFDYERLEHDSKQVKYGEYTARKVIFCEGWDHNRLAYFNWLPFRPVKGEILLMKGDLSENIIYNRGVFVLPHADGRWRIGSTYNNKDLDTVPSEEGKSQLLDKLKGLIKVDLDLIEHWAGVRPATADRKPYVGFHPNFETLGLFNGLGTKGVSLAPYFARSLVNNLENGAEIHEEANIKRHLSLYLKRNNKS